ncbi:hypothetical protein QFC19_000983 [Naganishia cerealis]|uniref:Uncharacterized protein n=1 Tax=Naganishia cerealis TaxID=610337 RepID=A0ACC2WKM3_9TREE|nr:hypothetical protein QFC19_000983 [Naganishia cerealis]
MAKALTLDDFHFLTRIGKGQFGKVDAVCLIENGQVYALKTIEKTKIARAGQALDIELEKEVLVRASQVQDSDNSQWMPTPRLLATFASPNCIHMAVSFSNCGTLWDLFCSTEAVEAYTNSGKERTEQEENVTLFSGGSQVDSGGLNSLFQSINGSSSLSASSRRLPETTLMVYIKQLVLALQWLHEEAGIVHRDVKPENVLLKDDGRAVMCDFGSAARLIAWDRIGKGQLGIVPKSKAVCQRTTETHEQVILNNGLWSSPRYLPLSACQTLHGTADYIAPEVLQTYEQFLVDSDCLVVCEGPDDSLENDDSAKGYDASVDWWSFGAMCYEMISGIPPFYAKTVQETYCMIMSCQIIRIPGHSAFSAEMSDFLTSLLVPSGKRLGRLGPGEVKRHPLFRNTDWKAVRNHEASSRPSNFQNPKPLRLPPTNSSQVESIYQDSPAPFDFSAFHMSLNAATPSWANEFRSCTGDAGSVDGNSTLANNTWLKQGTAQTDACKVTEELWINWEWVTAGINCPASTALIGTSDPPINPVLSSAHPRLPILDKLKREYTPNRAHLVQIAMQNPASATASPLPSPSAFSSRFKTPGRQIPRISTAAASEKPPLSVPRTMPRTVARGTGSKMVVMSEKRAFKMMVRCVEASAKKKIAASGRKGPHVIKLSPGPGEGHYAHTGNNARETSSAHRKRSFLSKLRAINIGDSVQTEERSDIHDLTHAAAPNMLGSSEYERETHSRVAPTFGKDTSAERSSSRDLAWGFEHFVADLQTSVNSAGLHSSPRRFGVPTGISHFSSVSDFSSSTDDEHHSSDLPAQLKPFGIGLVPPGRAVETSDDLPVEPSNSRNQRSVVPRRMETDELLSRLFPSYSGDSVQSTRLNTVNNSIPMDEMHRPRPDMPDVDRYERRDEAEMRSDSPLDSIRYRRARMQRTDQCSPTVVINGLVGQHQQMKKSLAVS